jgi:hypothetical protein
MFQNLRPSSRFASSALDSSGTDAVSALADRSDAAALVFKQLLGKPRERRRYFGSAATPAKFTAAWNTECHWT